MTNLEILNRVSEKEKNIAYEYYSIIDKMKGNGINKTETLRNLYIRPIDNYSILGYHKILNKDANELQCLNGNELSEIRKLFDLGIIDENEKGNENFDYEDLRECWKQTTLRRVINEHEKLIFLIYLNKIHDYGLRLKLINIFFTQKLSEEQRNDLIEKLIEEYVTDLKLKERKLA